MCRKSFTSSTFVRHLILSEVYVFMYNELITRNIQILLCKGFYAHMLASIIGQMHFSLCLG